MPQNGQVTHGLNYVTANRFYVEIEESSYISACFSECTGLSAKVNYDTYFEGGVNHQQRIILGHSEFSEVALKRGVTNDAIFLGWASRMLTQIEPSDRHVSSQRRNIPLGIQRPLGQTFLQPHFISPLGANSLSDFIPLPFSTDEISTLESPLDDWNSFSASQGLVESVDSPSLQRQSEPNISDRIPDIQPQLESTQSSELSSDSRSQPESEGGDRTPEIQPKFEYTTSEPSSQVSSEGSDCPLSNMEVDLSVPSELTPLQTPRLQLETAIDPETETIQPERETFLEPPDLSEIETIEESAIAPESETIQPQRESSSDAPELSEIETIEEMAIAPESEPEAIQPQQETSSDPPELSEIETTEEMVIASESETVQPQRETSLDAPELSETEIIEEMAIAPESETIQPQRETSSDPPELLETETIEETAIDAPELSETGITEESAIAPESETVQPQRESSLDSPELSETETIEETEIASETEIETIQPTSQTDREFDSLRSDLEIAQSNLQRETRETPTVQRHKDLQETSDRQPSPQSDDSFTTSTTTSQPLPDSSEPTVAQLLSDRDTDPSAPHVLDNLIQLQPLSDTTPLTPTVRHSSLSKTTSPPDLQPQADRTSNSADVPTAWSSINDLLGQVQASDRPSSKVQPPTDSHSQESIDPIFPPPRQSTTVQRQTDSQDTELVFTPQGFRRTAVKPQPQVVQKQDRPRISRQDTEPKTVSRPNQTHPSDLEDTQAFEHLAREIYQILRQRLEIERERHGGNYSGRSLW